MSHCLNTVDVYNTALFFYTPSCHYRSFNSLPEETKIIRFFVSLISISVLNTLKTSRV